MRSYINRELSWLDFNLRVLNQAAITATPLFERLRFISIFESNLDEFYMVRVGSLVDQYHFNPDLKDSKTQWNAEKQLQAIGKKTKQLIKMKDALYQNVIAQFKSEGHVMINAKKMSKSDVRYFGSYFKQFIQPLLSPQICDYRHPFPQLLNMQSYVVVRLSQGKGKSDCYGFIPVSLLIPPCVYFETTKRLILTNELITFFIKDIFPGYHVVETVTLKITRNADLDVHSIKEDFDETYLETMKSMLKKRKRLDPVRLACSNQVSAPFQKFLREHIPLSNHHVFYTTSPLSFSFLSFFEKIVRDQKQTHLFYPHAVAQPSPTLMNDQPLIPQIMKHDALLIYPYHSMNTLINLIEEAAYHPDVVSIKITLYRLASQSKIIDALIDVSNQGKEVTVYLELQARFDEENNIRWSNKLEASLVHVVYGFDHFKIHAKSMLITLKGKHRVNHLVHLGTGNYNEQTAQLYTDVNLFSSERRITDDVVHFFNQLSLASLQFDPQSLLIAPKHLKGELLDLIQQEIDLHHIYGTGKIVLKMNSLTDKQLIDALYDASDQGVDISLIIRGICCMVAQEHLSIYSVLGRYLEHARIFYFGARGQEKMYIASADLMTRNTEKRVELAIPIYDSTFKRTLLDYMMMQIRNPHTYQMKPDRTYHIIDPISTIPDSQTNMMQWAVQRSSHNGRYRSLIKKLIKRFGLFL